LRNFLFKLDRCFTIFIGVIHNPEKSEKINFEKYKTFLIEMLPLGKNPGWSSGHGQIPSWPWSYYQTW
jgi:hypothetical protein